MVRMMPVVPISDMPTVVLPADVVVVFRQQVRLLNGLATSASAA
jgi:hypothetical protein